MAWTSPRTWAVAEILTAALLNTHLRDNLNETGPAKAATAGYFLRVTGPNAIEEADPSDGAKLDGDTIDIDGTPTNYTPNASSPASDVDDLWAHLLGIDDALGNNAQTQATQAAIEAETDENTYIPPDMIRYSPGVAKGWAQFTVAGVLNRSYNVTSITDNGTGDWTVNWADDFSDANYAVIANSGSSGSGYIIAVNTIAVGTTRLFSFDVDDGATKAEDGAAIHVAAFGDQ